MLYSFVVGILYCAIYGVLFGLLTAPLHNALRVGNEMATTILHSLIVSLAGTLVCCLFYLLPDKQIALGGFLFLAVLLAISCLATLFLKAEQRAVIGQLLLLYAAGPVIVGNVAGSVVGNILKKHRRRREEDGMKNSVNRRG